MVLTIEADMTRIVTEKTIGPMATVETATTDRDLIRKEAKDQIRTEVIEVAEVTVLVGIVTETARKVAPDVAWLHNVIQGTIQKAEHQVNPRGATNRIDHNHLETMAKGEKYATTICEANAQAETAIKDHIQDLVNTGLKEHARTEANAHGHT